MGAAPYPALGSFHRAHPRPAEYHAGRLRLASPVLQKIAALARQLAKKLNSNSGNAALASHLDTANARAREHVGIVERLKSSYAAAAQAAKTLRRAFHFSATASSSTPLLRLVRAASRSSPRASPRAAARSIVRLSYRALPGDVRNRQHRRLKGKDAPMAAITRGRWMQASASRPRPGFVNIAAQYRILATGLRNPSLACRL